MGVGETVKIAENNSEATGKFHTGEKRSSVFDQFLFPALVKFDWFIQVRFDTTHIHVTPVFHHALHRAAKMRLYRNNNKR